MRLEVFMKQEQAFRSRICGSADPTGNQEFEIRTDERRQGCAMSKGSRIY